LGRLKPETVAARLTKEKKQLFYDRARLEGKTVQQVIEGFIDQYIRGIEI
jgi:hypothetical protein